MICDIVIDNSAGDCGKGKVVHQLLKNGNYTHALRGSGGDNCGHTIYHNGKKFVTHNIPAGVFFGVKSIIGPGCVLNPKTFFSEINYLTDNGIDCRNLVKVSNNVHIITEEHLNEDARDVRIGTTKRGIGQCYRDKYARIGIRAEDVSELKEYLCDFYEEIFASKYNKRILYEGAQGLTLDIDHGTYPYVTSSHTTVAGALLNGIPIKFVRNVYGVSKAYDTYVGAMKFQPENDQVLDLIQKVGNEFGATTQRKRQCNYLNINTLIKSLNINGVTNLIVNKMDVLQQVNCWKIIDNGNIINLKTEEKFRSYLTDVATNINEDMEVKFSYSPETI